MIIQVRQARRHLSGTLDSVPFMRWAKKNAIKILQDARHPDVQEMGLWVITKTTSAKHHAFSIATAKGTEIYWGITVEAQQAAKFEASTSWWTSHQGSEWISDSDVSQHELLSPLRIIPI